MGLRMHHRLGDIVYSLYAPCAGASTRTYQIRMFEEHVIVGATPAGYYIVPRNAVNTSYPSGQLYSMAPDTTYVSRSSRTYYDSKQAAVMWAVKRRHTYVRRCQSRLADALSSLRTLEELLTEITDNSTPEEVRDAQPRSSHERRLDDENSLRARPHFWDGM